MKIKKINLVILHSILKTIMILQPNKTSQFLLPLLGAHVWENKLVISDPDAKKQTFHFSGKIYFWPLRAVWEALKTP